MTDAQPSRIIAVIEAQRAALLARDTATLQRYVSQWRDVESAIRDSAELLANDMVASIRAGNPVSQNKLYQLERYQALLQQTRTQIQEYARQLAPQIEAEQASLWQQGQLDANDQIGAIVGTSFSRLPIEATNTIIGTTADGSPLRNTLLSHWPNAVDAITRELLRGVAMGTSPRVTARRAAAASQASLRQMLSVARTESLRAYRESSRALYDRSGVVKQYKRLAAKNARTCVLCLADDGTIYKVSEPLPIHVNCRCTSIPIIDGYNIETGKDGAEWFAAQSADTQRQMLGPSRYAMYKDGTPLSAFAGKHNDPTWGPTLVKPSIDAMGKRGVQLTHLYNMPDNAYQRTKTGATIAGYDVHITGSAVDNWGYASMGKIGDADYRYMSAGMGKLSKRVGTEHANTLFDQTIAPVLRVIPQSHLRNVGTITAERFIHTRSSGLCSPINPETGKCNINLSIVGNNDTPLAKMMPKPDILIHEIGHAVSQQITERQARQWLDAVGYRQPYTSAKDALWQAENAVDGPTEYGSTNPSESFAETYRLIHKSKLPEDRISRMTDDEPKYTARQQRLIETMREILGELE